MFMQLLEQSHVLGIMPKFMLRLLIIQYALITFAKKHWCRFSIKNLKSNLVGFFLNSLLNF